MEATPAETDLDAVIDDLRRQDSVLDIHHVHAWTLTSGRHAFSAHLRHADPANAAEILESAYNLLTHDYGFHMVTLQLETDCLDEEHAQDMDVLGRTTAADGDNMAVSTKPHVHHNAS